MKMSARILAGVLGLAAACCTFAAAAEQTESGGQVITRVGTYTSSPGSEQKFTGKVHINPVFEDNEAAPARAAYVTFEPGARTFWHSHPAGEHLIITFGTGLTGTEDGQVVEFWAGDEIWCPPGIRHWHGAAPGSAMIHIVIAGVRDGKTTDWYEEVTDAQYNPGEYITR